MTRQEQRQEHEDLADRFLAEMETHGRDPIAVEVELVVLHALVATVQLALRHPEFPDTTRAEMARFVAATIDRLRPRYPAIAAVMSLGNDPDPDTPTEPRR